MPWYEYSLGPSGYLLPLVEVLLAYSGRTVRVIALVDSGADTSLIDANHATDLELDRGLTEIAALVGADGVSFDTLRWPTTSLEIRFEGQRIPFTGAFVDFPSGSIGVSLLGRNDFFQRFIVQFWDAAGLMNIDVSPDFPRPPLV